LADEVGIEIESTLGIVVCWGRKTRRHPAGIERKFVLAFSDKAKHSFDLADRESHRPSGLSVLVTSFRSSGSVSSSSLLCHFLISLKYVTEFKKSKPFR
jgi:hypothetical protein